MENTPLLVYNIQIISFNLLILLNHKFINGTIYEKKANNSGRQLDEVVKFRHFSSNEAAYR